MKKIRELKLKLLKHNLDKKSNERLYAEIEQLNDEYYYNLEMQIQNLEKQIKKMEEKMDKESKIK